MAGIAATRRTNRLPSLWRSDPLTALQEEMNQLRTRLFGDGDGGWFTGTIVPELDVSETDAAIEVRMDVPGVTAKDIDIQVNGNVLTVSGERKEEKEEKGKTFHRIERRYGNFSRSVTLPCAVVESKVPAARRRELTRPHCRNHLALAAAVTRYRLRHATRIALDRKLCDDLLIADRFPATSIW
jgi:HSP20 family protein